MRIGLSASLVRQGRTGVGQYVTGLLRALANHPGGHTFYVFAFEEDAELFAFGQRSVRIVTIPPARRTAWSDFAWHQFTLPRLARDLSLDVLHVPSHRRLPWAAPCAQVGTLYDAGAFRPSVPRGSRMGSLRWTLFRQLAGRQDELVATSRSVAEEAACRCGVDPNHVTVIRPATDHRRFFPGDRERAAAIIAQRHGLHPPYFLYVARLEQPGKNHARLIEAFNAFKTSHPSPWQLALVGEAGMGAERIQEGIRRSPFAADIYCPGAVPMDELPEWYRAAGALVYPPRREGFCFPVLEAMACGCPVLASASGTVRELCGDAAVTVDPRDVSALRLRLADLAFDPALRTQLRTTGLARAREYDWNRAAEATLEVYERATRDHSVALGSDAVVAKSRIHPRAAFKPLRVARLPAIPARPATHLGLTPPVLTAQEFRA